MAVCGMTLKKLTFVMSGHHGFCAETWGGENQ